MDAFQQMPIYTVPFYECTHYASAQVCLLLCRLVCRWTCNNEPNPFTPLRDACHNVAKTTHVRVKSTYNPMMQSNSTNPSPKGCDTCFILLPLSSINPIWYILPLVLEKKRPEPGQLAQPTHIKSGPVCPHKRCHDIITNKYGQGFEQPKPTKGKSYYRVIGR